MQKNKEFAMNQRRGAFGWAQWVLLMVFLVVMEVEVVDGEKNNYY